MNDTKYITSHAQTHTDTHKCMQRTRDEHGNTINWSLIDQSFNDVYRLGFINELYDSMAESDTMYNYYLFIYFFAIIALWLLNSIRWSGVCVRSHFISLYVCVWDWQFLANRNACEKNFIKSVSEHHWWPIWLFKIMREKKFNVLHVQW